MYKRILVTVENSRYDEVILAHVEDLARLMGSSLLLVHVADGWAARVQDQLDLRDSDEIAEDREYLKSLRERFAYRGIPAETLLLLGDPPSEIIKLVQQEHVDLIAMTTHGHRFLADFFLGSTASKVRHAVEVPVLLLKAPAKP